MELLKAKAFYYFPLMEGVRGRKALYFSPLQEEREKAKFKTPVKNFHVFSVLHQNKITLYCRLLIPPSVEGGTGSLLNI